MNLRRIDSRFHGVLSAPVFLIALAAVLQLPALHAGIGFPPSEFPVQAAAAVESLPAGARLLAPDTFGGYLIYRFRGERKVYFDGRSDFYGSDFVKQYVRLMQVRPGWRQQMEGFGFTHVLLPNDYSLLAALEQLGWKRLYRDQVATLAERP